jgi:hypothetical protein
MHEETKQQTAVEFLSNEIKAARRLCDDLNMEMDIFHTLDVLIKISEQAKEIENKMLIDLVQSLKDYTRESHNILGFDEREASDFVKIFKENYKK